MDKQQDITILIVEDDNNLRLTLADNLEIEGYNVISVANLKDAKTKIQSAQLCILDIMLPDGSGYDFCQWVRMQAYECSIIMLTARSLDQDIDTGFEAGADDYLAKPYRMKELLLRINALLRRGLFKPSVTKQTDINGYSINWLSRQVTNNHKELIHFTKKEFDILQLLYKNLNNVLSREQILNEIWGKEAYIDYRTVDNFIANIKKRLKLKEGMFYIRTVRGIGYSLTTAPFT